MNAAPEISDSVLEVHDLEIRFFTEHGSLRAVDGVSFSIPRGRTLALVGESGCGKSVTAYSILKLVPASGRLVGGRILLHSARAGDIDVAQLDDKSPTLFQVRGGLVSMIFQEPMSALSPMHTIGNQICEAVRLHHSISAAEAKRRVLAMLQRVGILKAEERFNQYPHELSGGMRQRVIVAMALASQPELLIADEPTTALDVTTQSQILGLIKQLQVDTACAVLLITHDFGIVAQMADAVAVMYLGRIVEEGSVQSLMGHPRHPYTRGLLQSLPNPNTSGRLAAIPGSVPTLHAVPPGCPFHPRCLHARPGRCDVGGPPALRAVAPGQLAACLFAEEIDLVRSAESNADRPPVAAR